MKLSPALILLFIAGLFSLACHKDNNNTNNSLPPITQDGSNIIACRLNGYPWIIEYATVNVNTALYLGLFFNDTLAFGGTPEPKPYSLLIQSMYFHIYKNPRQGGVYSLNDTTAAIATFLTDSTCANFSIRNGTYLNSSSGSLSITRLDTINHIYSGTFDCVFPVPGCDTVKITDGQFDVHYY